MRTIHEQALRQVQNVIATYRARCAPLSAPPKPVLTSREFSDGSKNVSISVHPVDLRDQLPSFQHAHDMYEMTFAYQGEFHQCIDGRRITQAQNSLLLLNRGVQHRVWIENGGDIGINILVRCSYIESLFSLFLAQNTTLRDFFGPSGYSSHLFFPPSEEIRDIVDKMILEYYESRSLSDHALQGLLIQLLTSFTRMLQLRKPVPPTRETIRGDIRAYVDKNFATVRLADLSDVFCYSYRQIERIIHELYGMRFVDVINEKKVSLVERCRETGMPLGEALEEAGFSDAAYYRKVSRALAEGAVRRA